MKAVIAKHRSEKVFISSVQNTKWIGAVSGSGASAHISGEVLQIYQTSPTPIWSMKHWWLLATDFAGPPPSAVNLLRLGNFQILPWVASCGLGLLWKKHKLLNLCGMSTVQKSSNKSFQEKTECGRLWRRRAVSNLCNVTAAAAVAACSF